MRSKIFVAYNILKQKGTPMHINEIISISIREKMIRTKGKTPAYTLHANIMYEIKKRKEKKQKPRFVKTGPATFGLTEWENATY